MRFQYLLAALVVLVTCGAGLLFGNQTPPEKPSRAECIAGYRLDWPAVTEDRQHDISNSLDWPKKDGALKSLSAMALSMDGEYLYIQFSSHCPQKWQLSEELLAYWKNRERDFPSFERLPEPILPSLTTIEAKGKSWRD